MALFDQGFLRAAGDEGTQEKGFNIDHIIGFGVESVSDRTVGKIPWSVSDHRPVWATIVYSDSE
jgi:endonuclease/exonuclease/phosphatase family metal-dependent hydrolase